MRSRSKLGDGRNFVLKLSEKIVKHFVATQVLLKANSYSKSKKKHYNKRAYIYATYL